MPRLQHLLARVLGGTPDRNIRFNDLCGLLLALGFDERIRGGHHICTRSGVVDILNLQPRDGGMAKPYQVRQVGDVVVKYKLAKGVER